MSTEKKAPAVETKGTPEEEAAKAKKKKKKKKKRKNPGKAAEAAEIERRLRSEGFVKKGRIPAFFH